MSDKALKIIYWIATGLLCLIFAGSAGMYFTKFEMVKGFFEGFGYPTYIIYPLAVLKVLAIVAILTKWSDTLKEWAYAGLFLDLVLATAAHWDVGDGLGLSAIAFIPWAISYYLDRTLY